MGTTATSMHILRSPRNAASLGADIEKAYRRLGSFVAPKLWLTEALMREVDRSALEEVARLRERRRVTEIELWPSRSLADLETALAPLLPTFVGLG